MIYCGEYNKEVWTLLSIKRDYFECELKLEGMPLYHNSDVCLFTDADGSDKHISIRW